MVREVPTVKIKFGGGVEITRTLHGNIATYVCTSSGVVVDVIPGIYDHETYLSRLASFKSIAMTVSAMPQKKSLAFLDSYHRSQSTKNFQVPVPLTPPPNVPEEEIDTWLQLAQDTKVNESERRRKIYGLLSSMSPTSPAQLKWPLYRDVLHADLKDPYLGVDKVLSSNSYY